MSEDFLEKVEKLCVEDVKRRSPNSPCYSCQFFRKLQLIETSWVFKLPNPPDFANRETIHAWCLIEVLDRYPQPLYEGSSCLYWESREVPVIMTYELIKVHHPAYSIKE
jgi:hypothetical protein